MIDLKNKNGLFSVFFIFLSVTLFAQQKHALVITIAHYPAESGWNTIHADNDKLLVSEMLKTQDFPEENVIFLENQFATHKGIEEGFNTLTKRVKEGDVVYIHYSGHGQQIMDIGTKDEEDGYDESLVAYDSPKTWYDGYNGSKHFVDDELSIFLKEIRRKLGKKGQLVVVFDSCHSGTATRGESNDEYTRGADKPCAPESYVPDNKINPEAGNYDVDYNNKDILANITFYAGSRADQVNHEYFDFESREWYGSLTYHFSKAMQKLDSTSTHRNVYANIRDGYINNSRTRNQEPDLESDNEDELVFNGKVIKQQPFYDLSNIDGEIITIKGGSVHGLVKGDSIGFFNNDVFSVAENKALFSGEVIQVNISSSQIKISQQANVLNRDRAKYRAFITIPALTPTKIYLKLDIKDKNLKRAIIKHLKEQSNIEIVDNAYEYILRQISGNSIDLIVASSGLTNSSLSFAKDENLALVKLDKNLNKLTRLKAFMDVTYDNPNIDLGFKNSPAGIKTSGESDSFTIQNNGDNSIYVYYYYVGPNMISSFVPIGKGNNIYKKIYPNSEFSFPLTYSCNEDDPCGMNRLKLIVANNEISGIENLLEMNTVNYGTRGTDESGLLQYFGNKLIGTRGVEEPNIEAVNFYFEIKDN